MRQTVGKMKEAGLVSLNGRGTMLKMGEEMVG